MKTIVSPGPARAGSYSAAVRAGELIHVSGTIAEDHRGAIGPVGQAGAQTKIVLERLRGVLAAAGSSLDQVASVMVYLTSAAHFEEMNEAYRPFWPAAPPTRTTVITTLVNPAALVEISLIAIRAGGERIIVQPDRWSRSPSPYSYAIRTGEMLFLSGLVARRGRDNVVVEGDIGAQTRTIMENGAELLEAAGLTFANVVSSRVYLTDAANFAGMNDTYRQFFAGAPPARVTVQAGLAGSPFLVEMTFTASSAARHAVGTAPAGIPLSPAIKAGNRLYVSGMLGNTPGSAADVSAQTHQALTRIRTTLERAGASPADVVDSTVYITSTDGLPGVDGLFRHVFGPDLPAGTTVITPLVVADGLVEIVVTALLT